MVYKHKSVHDVQRVYRRATQGARRYKFQVERYNGVKYKNNPFYKGSEPWDLLPHDTIDSESLTEFKKCLKKHFVTYIGL